jgi:hypothetical protein
VESAEQVVGLLATMTSAEWEDLAEAHRPRRFLLESVAPVVDPQRATMTKLKKTKNNERN